MHCSLVIPDKEQLRMQFFPIERNPDDFQQGLTPEQVQAVCDRAFGPIQIESARELGGGEFNSVYLVRLAEREPLILRGAHGPARRDRASATAPRRSVDLQPADRPPRRSPRDHGRTG